MLVNYDDMIRYCCEFSVTEDDGLPAQICTNCLTKLKTSYKFKQKCIESNTELLNLKAKTPRNKNEELGKFNEFHDETPLGNRILGTRDVELVFENSKYDSKKLDKVEDIKARINSENTNIENNGTLETDMDVEFQVDKPHKDDISNRSTEENTEKSKPILPTENQSISKAKSNDSQGPEAKKKSKKLECDTCGQQFYKAANLHEHINWKHYGIKKYHCDICNKDYMNEKNHRELHEKPQEEFSATCNQCGKTYSSQRKYKYHITKNHGDKDYICECGATFKSDTALKKHIKGVHEPKRYMCHICSKAFAMKTYLILHLRLHTGEKPYKCHLCNMSFRVMFMFKRHMQGKHSDVRSLKCPQCPKEFKTRNVLTKHMAVHAETRQFACRVCHKPFSRRDNRNVHERSVHSISRDEAKLMWSV